MDTVPKECRSCVKEPTGTINVARFIQGLDRFFAHDDLKGACEFASFWENEARSLGDARGLLSVVNEELGLYRRTNDAEAAMRAVETALALLDGLEMSKSVSGANILVNAATTLKAFGRPAEGLKYYDIAEADLVSAGRQGSYEYAALLNNKAAALNDLERYDEGERCYLSAIDILKKEGRYDGEIAVSLINLAHLVFDRDDTAYERVENLLDEAWEYINSPRQPHDANYAFILSKCAPSLDYFGRHDEADALREVAKEIYERT